MSDIHDISKAESGFEHSSQTGSSRVDLNGQSAMSGSSFSQGAGIPKEMPGQENPVQNFAFSGADYARTLLTIGSVTKTEPSSVSAQRNENVRSVSPGPKDTKNSAVFGSEVSRGTSVQNVQNLSDASGNRSLPVPSPRQMPGAGSGQLEIQQAEYEQMMKGATNSGSAGSVPPSAPPSAPVGSAGYTNVPSPSYGTEQASSESLSAAGLPHAKRSGACGVNASEQGSGRKINTIQVQRTVAQLEIRIGRASVSMVSQVMISGLDPEMQNVARKGMEYSYLLRDAASIPMRVPQKAVRSAGRAFLESNLKKQMLSDSRMKEKMTGVFKTDVNEYKRLLNQDLNRLGQKSLNMSGMELARRSNRMMDRTRIPGAIVGIDVAKRKQMTEIYKKMKGIGTGTALSAPMKKCHAIKNIGRSLGRSAMSNMGEAGHGMSTAMQISSMSIRSVRSVVRIGKNSAKVAAITVTTAATAAAKFAMKHSTTVNHTVNKAKQKVTSTKVYQFGKRASDKKKQMDKSRRDRKYRRQQNGRFGIRGRIRNAASGLWTRAKSNSKVLQGVSNTVHRISGAVANVVARVTGGFQTILFLAGAGGAGFFLLAFLFFLLSIPSILFNFNLSGNEYIGTETYGERMQEVIYNCWVEDMNKIMDLSGQGSYNAINLTYEDHRDEEAYEEYMEAHTEFEQSSNCAEILSMSLVYFNLDFEEVAPAKNDKGWQEIEDYLKGVYYGSHAIKVGAATTETYFEEEEEEEDDENADEEGEIEAASPGARSKDSLSEEETPESSTPTSNAESKLDTVTGEELASLKGTGDGKAYTACIEKILPIVMEACESIHVLPSVAIGQMIEESGFDSDLSRNDNNFGGIKGKKTYSESTFDGTRNGSYSHFSSFNEYIWYRNAMLIHSGYYTGIEDVCDPQQELQILMDGGYLDGTDDEKASYMETILKNIDSYDLTQYDRQLSWHSGETYSWDLSEDTTNVSVGNITYVTYYLDDLFDCEWEGLTETPVYNYSSSASLGTITDERGVYLALRSAGMTHAGACGVMGNIQQESSFNPADKTGKYHGLFQLGDDRLARQNQWCSDNGYDPDSMSGQVQFMIHCISDGTDPEYNSYSWSKMWQILTTSDDARECASVFCVGYERCVNGTDVYQYKDVYWPYSSSKNYLYQDLYKRISYAQSFESQYESIQDTWQNEMGNTAITEFAAKIANDDSYYYIYGADGPKAYDCSHFVWYVLKQCGYNVSYHTSRECLNIEGSTRVSDATSTSWGSAQAGDIIVWDGHVAFYGGNNTVIHAKSSKAGIVVDTGITGPNKISSHKFLGIVRMQ